MSNTIRVIVTHYHTNWGQSRLRVQAEGRQKSVAYDYSSHDPYLTAMLEVLGRGVKIEHDERDHGHNRIVFHVYANTVQIIRPDYTVKTYADGYGRWTARIVFPYGAGNTGEGERLISNARRAAQRAIRQELMYRAPIGGKLPRLSYEVVGNSENPSSGALASLTIREA
jgi:hypothetical protein